MQNLLPYQIFFSLLAGIGFALLVSSLFGLFHRGDGSKRMQSGLGTKGQRDLVVSDVPPFAQRFLAVPFTDLGMLIFGRRDPESVESQLRRSGWRYRSVGDYYASKMVLAVAYFVGGVALGLAWKLSPVLIALCAFGAGIYGLYRPDSVLRAVIKLRREAIFREMAWTLDRIAMVMKTGEALGPTLNRLTGKDYAWVSGGSGGLFVALLRDVAAGLASQRHDIKGMLADLRATLPDELPELDEFLQLLEINLVKKQPITDQLRVLGRVMRDELNNRIDKVAQQAQLMVSVIQVFAAIPALLLVVAGAAAIGFMGLL